MFRVNEFFYPFAEIVNTYGIPTYKEASPALFTAISFPFLFGVMFGDIMHGALLFLWGVYLCFGNRSNPYSITGALGPYRYLFLLMGLFSFYCGMVYNDFTSMATETFGKTCFSVIEKGKNHNEFAHKLDKNCVYPFGIDPIWYRSSQEISYMNSFKMKISVIYGVAQMLFGTTLKGMNAAYFKRWNELIFEVFTQVLLMVVLFGFMDFMIVLKWVTDWSEMHDGKVAPGIISTMIVMFINFGTPPKDSKEAALISNQTAWMRTMLIIAVFCVPIMLLAKPIIESKKAKKEVYDDFELQDNSQVQEVKELLGFDPSKNIHEHGLGEMLIHQMIETIEYALGTISNTASYLRLWALSLAHSQLAKVFFDFTLGMGLKGHSYFLVSSN